MIFSRVALFGVGVALTIAVFAVKLDTMLSRAATWTWNRLTGAE